MTFVSENFCQHCAYSEISWISIFNALDGNWSFDKVKSKFNLGYFLNIVFTSDGKKWLARRKMLTPAFHFNILETFLSTMNEQAQVLVSIMQQKVSSTSSAVIDVVPLITYAALDIICGEHFVCLFLFINSKILIILYFRNDYGGQNWLATQSQQQLRSSVSTVNVKIVKFFKNLKCFSQSR